MNRELYVQLYEQEKSHWWFVGRRAIIATVLTRLLRKTKKKPHILEIGCGTGGNLELLAKFGYLEAIEFDKEAVQLSQEKNICKVTEGSLPKDIPYNITYDLVAMFDVLEHIDDDLGSLLTIRKILEPKGQLILTVPAFMFLWSEHDDVNQHKRRYSKKSLISVVKKAGFDVEYITYFNTFLFPAITFVRSISRLFKQKSGSDLSKPTPNMVNQALTGLFAAERFFFPWASFPFGVSILVVVRHSK